MIILLIVLILAILLILYDGHAKKYCGGNERHSLPYRNIAECYLEYDGKIVAQVHDKYIMFPGGGVDDNETPEQAAIREIEEEIGAKLDGKLEYVTMVEWDWMPEWANNEKRKQRYQQFRGERVYFFCGKIDKVYKPTSVEGDAWSGEIAADVDFIIQKHKELSKIDHPNTTCYRAVQQSMMYIIKSRIQS